MNQPKLFSSRVMLTLMMTFTTIGHAGARAFRRNRSGTTRTGRRDVRGSPRIDVPVSLSLEEFVVTAIPG